MPIRYSDLCKKEVVSTCDGCRLGFVSDIEFDTLCGRVSAIFVPKRHKLFSKCEYYVIRWDQIERIGADMILVKLPKASEKQGC